MKHSVLIVEDEKPARDVFRRMVEASEQLEVVGEAENGKQGFAMIAELRPDFVVMDITMPVLSGIDLLKELKAASVELPRTVILSCHQDFHYAQQAIHLGASGYLLKDDCMADVGLLARTLAGLIPDIVHSKEAARNRIELERKLRTHDVSLSRNAFLEAVRRTEGEWRDYLSSIGFPRGMPVHALVVVEYDRKSLRFAEVGEELESELHIWQFAGVNVLQELLSQHGFAKAVSVDGSRFVAVCAMKQEPAGIVETISRAFLTFLKINVFVRYEVLCHSMAGSQQIARRLCGEELLFFYDALQTVRPTDPSARPYPPMPKDKADDWTKTLRDAWIDDPVDTGPFDAFRGEAHANRWQPDDVRNVYIEALLGYKLLHNELARESGIHSMLVKGIQECRTLRQIELWLADRQAERRQARFASSSTDKHITRILDIVNADLTRHYSLQELADSVGYSPPYLSQAFKKTVGMTFSQYVMNQRIRRAKQLLASTDLKTFEVASEVGLDNYRHFNKIFKRMTGMNPSEFRAQIKRR